MICSTIRDIIVQAEKRFQGEDAIRSLERKAAI